MSCGQVGDTAVVRCEVLGGRPSPAVTWWRDHALLDTSYHTETRWGQSKDIHKPMPFIWCRYKVVNELTVRNLQRSDLHSILTCQAVNNNASVPVSTSVKLDLTCEYKSLSPKQGMNKMNKVFMNGPFPIIEAAHRVQLNSFHVFSQEYFILTEKNFEKPS